MQQQTAQLLSAAVSLPREVRAVWRANALGPKAALERWADRAGRTGPCSPKSIQSKWSVIKAAFIRMSSLWLHVLMFISICWDRQTVQAHLFFPPSLSLCLFLAFPTWPVMYLSVNPWVSRWLFQYFVQFRFASSSCFQNPCAKMSQLFFSLSLSPQTAGWGSFKSINPFGQSGGKINSLLSIFWGS